MKNATLIAILFASPMLIVAACLQGCNPPGENGGPVPTPSTSYTVSIDPTFSAAYQGDVIGAVDRWQDALGAQVKLTTVVQTCQGNNDEICVKPVSEADLSGDCPEPEGITTLGCTERDSWNDFSYVNVATTLDDATFTMLTAHELGHAMGLHHTETNTLMFWLTGGMLTAPGCEDMLQWHQARNEQSTAPMSCPSDTTVVFFH